MMVKFNGFFMISYLGKIPQTVLHKHNYTNSNTLCEERFYRIELIKCSTYHMDNSQNENIEWSEECKLFIGPLNPVPIVSAITQECRTWLINSQVVGQKWPTTWEVFFVYS